MQLPHRPAPRSALVVLGVLAALVAVVLTVRAKARHYLESAELRRELEQAATGALREVDPGLALRLPKARSDAFLGVRLSSAELVRRGKPVLGFSAHADLDLFPAALTGGAAFVGGVALAGGGRIEASGRLSLGAALGLLDGELSEAPTLALSAREIDAATLAVFWPKLADNPSLVLQDGRLGGQLSHAGGEKTARLTLRVERTRWKAVALGNQPLVLPPWTAELGISADAVTFIEPIRLQTPISPVSIEGAIHFAGEGTGGTELALTVTSAAGPMGRVALARLFRCQAAPAKDKFTVAGPVGRPRCR